MIIRLKSKNGPKLWIPVPLGLLCNRLTAGIAAKAMAQNGWNATPEQMAKLFWVLRQCRRRFPGLVLTEAESAEGDRVQVKL